MANNSQVAELSNLMSGRQLTDAVHLVFDVPKGNDIHAIFGRVGIPAAGRCGSAPAVINEAVTANRRLTV